MYEQILDEPIPPAIASTALLTLLFNLDDAFVIARKDDVSQSGWVRFVFGNDGFDVISDYTTNLEHVLAPIIAYADTLDPR